MSLKNSDFNTGETMRTAKKIREPWEVEMEIKSNGLLSITLVNRKTGEIRQCDWTKEEAAIFCFGIKNLQNYGRIGDEII